MTGPWNDLDYYIFVVFSPYFAFRIDPRGIFYY